MVHGSHGDRLEAMRGLLRIEADEVPPVAKHLNCPEYKSVLSSLLGIIVRRVLQLATGERLITLDHPK